MTGYLRELIWRSGETSGERRLSRAAIYLLLLLVVVVLGLNWPLMATGLRSVPPVWMGVFRVAGAAVVVLTLAASTGKLRLPPRRDIPMILSLAVFRLATVFVLVFTALRLVPAGRSSVVVWTTSLWTVPIAAVFLGERMSGRRWIGLAAGVVGVAVLSEPWAMSWGQPGVAVGHGLLVLAAITNAATAVHIRGHRWTITPLEAVPWQLAGAAIPLVALALAVEGVPVIDWTPQLAAIVAYQGMLATGVAFWAQLVILRNLSAISANLTLMGVPVVGVLSSAVLLDEAITLTLAAGMFLIMVGVGLNLVAEAASTDDPGPL
jgi:drug/metabolite transporter (DMT)-like permease